MSGVTKSEGWHSIVTGSNFSPPVPPGVKKIAANADKIIGTGFFFKYATRSGSGLEDLSVIHLRS